MIILQHAEILGAVSLLFLEPSPDNPSTEAQFSNTSASLEALVELEEATPLVIEKNTPWSVDWSQLSRTGQGNPLNIHRINRLELGRYEQDTQALEEEFFQLPNLAIESISFDIEGLQQADLPPLEQSDSWLLVLWCDLCDNPVPPFVGKVHIE